MSRISMWLLDEASSGTAPTIAADADASPVDLAITQGNAGQQWMSDAGGNGYTFNNTATRSVFDSGVLTGTKIATTLAGATQATWVVKCQRTTGSNNTIAGITTAGDSSAFQLYDQGEVWFGGQQAANTPYISDTNMHVIAVVIDSTQAVAADRCKIYVDGTQVTSGSGLTINRPIDNDDPWTSQHVVVGNNSANTAGYIGNIKWAGLYGHALSASEVAAISTALAANDDADPSGGTGVVCAWWKA